MPGRPSMLPSRPCVALALAAFRRPGAAFGQKRAACLLFDSTHLVAGLWPTCCSGAQAAYGCGIGRAERVRVAILWINLGAQECHTAVYRMRPSFCSWCVQNPLARARYATPLISASAGHGTSSRDASSSIDDSSIHARPRTRYVGFKSRRLIRGIGPGTDSPRRGNRRSALLFSALLSSLPAHPIPSHPIPCRPIILPPSRCGAPQCVPPVLPPCVPKAAAARPQALSLPLLLAPPRGLASCNVLLRNPYQT
ncbi:hypothetical protein PCL_10651 [Purpureocillium lilacinum]|uniref:Uncharacterized protein n=1 Tax=Purpureocillium lilacinum TaxID=33203 RepID=A0A2U3EC02_PURLI|nr:hypothetical protein PCL_10651 [Purpureocillium lilacinum]